MGKEFQSVITPRLSAHCRIEDARLDEAGLQEH
jgi:hypothetical protein